jgi:hypothetical protein
MLMKDNLTDLRHQLDSLQEDFHSLIPELTQAAIEVEKPRLFPLLNFSEKIIITREKFTALRNRIIEAAESFNVSPIPPRENLVTLGELQKVFIQTLISSQTNSSEFLSLANIKMEDKLADLQQELDSLQEALANFQSELSKAVRELATPRTFDFLSFSEPILKANDNFITLRAKVIEVAESLNISSIPPSENLVTLSDLQKLFMKAVMASQHQSNELLSSVGVNYAELRNWLAAEQWEEANKETERLIIKAAGKEEIGFLEKKDIENFPCEDFHFIDQLWQKYSNERFGLSVQKRIWKSGSYDWRGWCQTLGWMRGPGHSSNRGYYYPTFSGYNNLTFNLDDAPLGHLPSAVIHIRLAPSERTRQPFMNSFFSRLETCGL